MTEINTPATSHQLNADGAESVTEGIAPGEPQNGSQPREMRYRVERNAAREELAAANERIERMNRAEVERLAGDRLVMPGDLFSLSGNDLADYLNESGDVDAGKVAADVAAVLAERPGLGKRPPFYDPTQGQGGQPPKGTPAFGDLFK